MMKFKGERRGSKLATGASAVALAAALLVSAACSSNSDTSDRDDVPSPVPTLRDELDGLINIDSLAGPTSVTWEACPKGGVRLNDKVRVNASNSNQDGHTEINRVTRYLDPKGGVIAWCGESVGVDREWGISGPPEGTIVVIPANPSCLRPPSEPASAGSPCPDKVIEYLPPEKKSPPLPGKEEPSEPSMPTPSQPTIPKDLLENLPMY